VGRGVSVSVRAGVLVGAGVAVSVGGSGVDVKRGPVNGSVSAGASVAGGSCVAIGAWVGAGAAPPQDVKNNDKTKINRIHRIIQTHSRTSASVSL
jgi:hypothetical protein